MNPIEDKNPFESKDEKDWQQEYNSFSAYYSTYMGTSKLSVTLLHKSVQPEPHVCIPDTIRGKDVTTVHLFDSFYGSYIQKGIESIFIPATVTEITGLNFEATKDLKSIVVADDNPVYWSDGKALYSKDKTQLLKIFAYHLYEFKVPDGVRSISEYAFRGQWNLRKIIFPKSLEQIEQYAFYRCINLSTVIGIESVERIEFGAFMETPYWSGERIWIHDGVLKWYAAPGQTFIQVPEGVREIDAYAFDSKDPVVERIELPSTLKRIDQNAFNIRLAFYWTPLGKKPDPSLSAVRPFYPSESQGLRRLTEISIPEGVKEIPIGLFRELPALETIRLPASVVSIASGAFPPNDSGSAGSCLKAIEVDPRNEVFTSINGVLYAKDLTRLIKVPGGCPLSVLQLPDNLETIDSDAFRYNWTIKRVVLPQKTWRIGNGAFANSSLEYINLENITRIGEEAFWLCNLKEVSINCQVIPPNAFRACGSDGFKVHLENTRIIKAHAFTDSRLTSIELPETLQTIGEGAFSGCPLEQVTIPRSVQSIGSLAFLRTKHLTIYDSLQANIGSLTISYGACPAHTVSVLSAETGLLKSSVSFPPVDSHESAEILKNAWKPGPAFDFTAIDRCFPKLYSVESKLQTCIIRLKDPVDLSDENREQYDSYLKKNSRKVLTDLIDRNDLDGFITCSENGMIRATNVHNLMEYAHMKNALSFSAFLLDYNEKHFGHPKADLQSFSIGSGAKAPSPWSHSRSDPSCVLRYTGADTEIVFPTELRGRMITGIAERKTTIPENYKALVSVEIPEGYESIGNHAFECCHNLEYVILPSTLKRIGASAFAECGNLKKIILPDTVSYIGAGCFAHCSSLTTVNLPKALRRLEEGTFWNCLSLKTIDIPKNIEYIGDRCFRVSGLQSATIHHLEPKVSQSAFDKNVIITAYRDRILDFTTNKVTLADMPSETTVLISGTEKWGSPFSFRLFIEKSEQTFTRYKKRILRADFNSFRNGNVFADWLTGVYTEPLLSVSDIQAELLKIRSIGSLSSVRLREEKINEDGHTFAEYAFDYDTCTSEWRREGTFTTEAKYGLSNRTETYDDDPEDFLPKGSNAAPPSQPTASGSSLFSFTPVSSIDFDGKIFVLTGFDENDESRLTHIIIENGGELKSSVVLKTDYLIVNENYDHQTTKYKRAVELNGKGKDIKILSSAMFYRLSP